MAVNYQTSRQTQSEFREVFHNCYVTGFSISALMGTIFRAIAGLAFSAVFLYLTIYFALIVLYSIFGINPLGLTDESDHSQPITISAIIEGVIALVGWFAFFAYLGPHSVMVVKRRLLDRWYVLSGRPLASIEGAPTFDTGSEISYYGVEVGEFYFNLHDCCLDIDDKDMGKLESARGEMRIWYIPTAMREWTNPRTGELVKYDCTLVRAEWRPVR